MKKMKLQERLAIDWVKRGILSIDRKGRVWKHRTRHGTGPWITLKKPKRAERNKRGYLTVYYNCKWDRCDVGAHRLVWQFFFGNIPDGLTVNHENGKKADNKPKNLSLMTYGDNIRHAFRVIKTRSCKGENHSQHKLTGEKVLMLRYLRDQGHTLSYLADQFDITVGMTSRICSKKSWSHI